VRHFLLGLSFVFLLVVDLWWLVGGLVGTAWMLKQEGAGGIYLPGVAFAIAFMAILGWLTVRIRRRVAAGLRASRQVR